MSINSVDSEITDTLDNVTKRNVVSSLEAILYEQIKVLDHGFIRVIDYMGDDAAITQAARVSYGKGTKKTNEDKGLISYLMQHRHTTPFEMCEIKLHVKLPIFIARQWIRHRSASVNEYSARYSILGKEFYIPQRENLSAQSLTNKQGRASQQLNPQQADYVLDLLKKDSLMCYEHYQEMLNEDQAGNVLDENKPSIARELARMNLTLNYYTEWYWKIDLHNLLHFLMLRADSHAQYEIRVYAEKILDIVSKWVPYTYEAFMEHRINARTLSAKAIAVVKTMLKGQQVSQEQSGLNKRQWQELMAVFAD
jgi:thymidylate synthase (FAD)